MVGEDYPSRPQQKSFSVKPGFFFVFGGASIIEYFTLYSEPLIVLGPEYDYWLLFILIILWMLLIFDISEFILYDSDNLIIRYDHLLNILFEQR